jgi:ABC-type Fe3+-hydroxamate transport system substrate-binding protein
MNIDHVDLSKVYANLAARGREPTVSVQAVQNLDTATFKVVAAVAEVKDEADFSAAVASMTEGRGRVVPGSFNMKGRIAVAVVTANAQSKPMDASFQQVTASTALDPTGRIWSVVDDNGAKRVVLESSDDLADILKSRMASRAIHANPVEGRGLASVAFTNGDLVRYVDTAKRETSFGLVFQTELGHAVITPDFESALTINPDAVIAAVPRTQLPGAGAKTVNALEATAKLAGDKLNKIMDYLRKAYPKGAMADKFFSEYRSLAEKAK